jgi:hypothetical protein
MGKKLALNVLYTIGIFVCIAIGYWGFQHHRYEYIVAAVFIGILFIVLKVKLLKDLRNTRK